MSKDSSDMPSHKYNTRSQSQKKEEGENETMNSNAQQPVPFEQIVISDEESVQQDEASSDSSSDDESETDSDPEYIPDEEFGDEDGDEDDDEDDGELEMNEIDMEALETDWGFDDDGHGHHPNVHLIPGRHQMMLIIPPPPPPPRERYNTVEPEQPQRKRMRGEEYAFTQGMTPEEKAYWRNLDEDKKAEFLEVDKRMKEVHEKGKMPWRFKFLSSDIDVSTKSIILAKLDQFQNMHEGSGEFYKLRNWLYCIARLPLGTYFPLPVSPSDPFDKVSAFLKESRATLDSKVYGHVDAKSQIMRIFAQWIANPKSRGHCIGIQGPPGIGKTQMVKNGICKALGLPFGFVALGGASDASFLEGHGFTYEGSTHGKIAEILMKTQCMNPIFFFDELDKVSSTSRGDEIIGVLTHLTDSTQNERFTDRYFGGVELNLSRALIIFSYNDESAINPILKDRMITIRVKGYSLKEKLTIARDYLLPEILSQYNLNVNDVNFPLSVIEMIVQRVPQEEGVRNLKRGLESVVSWLNMHRYVPPENDDIETKFPLTVTEQHIHKYLYVSEDPMAMRPEVARMMYI